MKQYPVEYRTTKITNPLRKVLFVPFLDFRVALKGGILSKILITDVYNQSQEWRGFNTKHREYFDHDTLDFYFIQVGILEVVKIDKLLGGWGKASFLGRGGDLVGTEVLCLDWLLS
jgi:hypothetical protein